MNYHRATSRVWGVIAAVILALGQGVMAGDAISAGEVQTRSTWACLGINWHFAGDDNRNASAAVEFRRKGTTPWRPALPLWVHDFEKTLMFSGSVFRLAPGTEYEVKLTLTDPDGGGEEKIVTATTNEYPRMPGKTVAVAGGLAEAQQQAAPGTVMLLKAGTYPGLTLSKSGRPGQPIVYRPAGDGEVIIDGTIEISSDYVWLHGLTLRSADRAIKGGGKGVTITACKAKAHYTIHTNEGGDGFFIADNVLTGDCAGKFSFGGEGVDFGKGAGGGHAVCYNEITDAADGVSYGGGNIDVYSNYIHETVDDFIEPDYSLENYRLWDNRCYNSMCGFSFQPMKGGPWYVFNNLAVGNYLHALKVKDISGATVLYGNTMLTKSAQLGQAADIFRGTLVNNLWLRCTDGALGEGGKFRPGKNPTMIDYNAYGAGKELFRKCDYEELAEKQGWDKHSLRVEYDKLFVQPVKVPAGSPRYGEGVGKLIPADWKFEHNLLVPKADSKIIDAGTVLPNLTGPFLGKAPDIGAHEAGLGTAWYGPRTWDLEAGLAYGLPAGWKKLPPDKASQFSSLGCPPAKAGSVLLAGESPKVFALLAVEPARGEVRWEKARQFVGEKTSAETPVLEYQDGFYMRLYARERNAVLLVARVEPEGVLYVTIGCSKADLPQARLTMFQFARSLFR